VEVLEVVQVGINNPIEMTFAEWMFFILCFGGVYGVFENIEEKPVEKFESNENVETLTTDSQIIKN